MKMKEMLRMPLERWMENVYVVPELGLNIQEDHLEAVIEEVVEDMTAVVEGIIGIIDQITIVVVEVEEVEGTAEVLDVQDLEVGLMKGIGKEKEVDQEADLEIDLEKKNLVPIQKNEEDHALLKGKDHVLEIEDLVQEKELHNLVLKNDHSPKKKKIIDPIQGLKVMRGVMKIHDKNHVKSKSPGLEAAQDHLLKTKGKKSIEAVKNVMNVNVPRVTEVKKEMIDIERIMKMIGIHILIKTIEVN